MKYNMSAKVFGVAFTKLLKDYYKKNYTIEEFNKYKKAIKKEYRAMVERTPGIGGKKNSLESNLIGACYFFAMAKVIPYMTPELMNKMVDASIYSPLMVKMHQGKKKKGTLFLEKTHNKKKEEAKRSQTSTYEMDWKYTYESGKDEFFYTYTKCGVCKLAEREGVKEYLPSMCRMDFAKFDLQGGKLYRTKTLANGDDCCDFHIVRNIEK